MTLSQRYTGGDTMPPFPVMHGSMYVEVQTLDECYRTSCGDCAYHLHVIESTLPISKANCSHKAILYFGEAADNAR